MGKITKQFNVTREKGIKNTALLAEKLARTNFAGLIE
jgi:hypothetical protein